jgi:hypothetical protein
MADTLQQQEAPTGSSPVVSSLIPAGREKDYWELPAPSTHFLDMEIDRANMYIGPLLITNGSEDRDGEVTNPNGLIDVAFRKAPVVFLQHSHRIKPMAPPVGTAETVDRAFDLHQRPDGWYSGCRFTQAIKFPRQVFRLIDDGVLRGRSIGALNHQLANYKPRLPGVTFHQGQIQPVRTRSISHEKYELIEWSWVWMPANREIVTPVREITPAKEVVPVLKGILFNNKLDDTSLDPDLKMILKSLNLAEPTTNLNHSGKVRYWPFQKSFGANHVETPFAVLFGKQNYTPAAAQSFLKSSGDIGLIETSLVQENRGGALYLKSVQFAYDGPVEEKTHPDCPGLVLLFAKSASEEVAAEVVGDAEKVDLETPQKPAPKPNVKAEGAEGGEVVAEATDDAAMVKMQPGLRYLKALISKATQMVEEAEAAVEEQEPELMEKCKEFTSELRGFIGKVAAFQSERYGKHDEAGQETATAALEKSVRADLFYGRKAILPQPFTKGLNALHSMVTDDRQKALTAAMLKGVIGDSVMPPQTDDSRAALRQKLREGVVRKLTAGLS